MSPDEPFGQASDPDEEFGVLCRALEMRQGFSLYFVLCNDARERDRRISQLRERFSEESFQEVAVAPEEENLLWRLRESPSEKPPRAVFVHSLENWLAADRDGDSVAFLRSLNVTRNTFPLEFPMPFIFWVPIFLLRLFSQGCPDFLSVRSGLYNLNFDTPTPMEQDTIRLFSNQENALLLPFFERKKRIIELEKQLKEYQKLPLNQKDFPVEIRLIGEIAMLYDTLAKFKKAENLYRKAIDLSIKHFGRFHTETATYINNLGILMENTGRISESENLLREALSIKENILPPDHPELAIQYNNLAALLKISNKDEESEQLFNRSLSIDRATLGTSHLSYGMHLNNYAQLLEKRQKHKEAETLFRQSLQIVQENLGSSHPNTATSLNNLALCLIKIGQYKEAETLLRQAILISENIMGPKHPDTATRYNNLGGVLQSMGHYNEAEQIFRKSLLIHLEIYKMNDHNLKNISNNWLKCLIQMSFLIDKIFDSQRIRIVYRILKMIEPLKLPQWKEVNDDLQRYISK